MRSEIYGVAGLFAFSDLGFGAFTGWKTLLAFAAAALVVGGAYWTILKGRKDRVEYIIAFDVTVFAVGGLAAAVIVAENWATAMLCAGASLLIGGFVGLLFGVPYQSPLAQGAAGKRAAHPSSQGRDGGAPPQDLLAETASWLSKIVVGASLARLSGLIRVFKSISGYVSGYLLAGSLSVGPRGVDFTPVFGGALLLYFGMLGFLSGLFLPAYFMPNWRSGGAPPGPHPIAGNAPSIPPL